MLPDWYFCCCINAYPATAHALLSIFDVFENEESDQELLGLALDELGRTEVWMQVYALPQVLRVRRRDDWPVADSGLEKYFDNLSESAPEQSRPAFSVLKKRVLDGGSPRDKEMQECAAVVNRLSLRQAAAQVSVTPYLDLKEFLPETMALAVLADMMDEEEGSHEQWARRVTGPELEARWGNLLTDPEVERLLANALEGRAGRLALRLAALIQLRVGKRKVVLPALLNATDAVVALEPDLLPLVARAIFQPADNLTPPRLLARGLLRESWTFHAYREHLQSSLARSSGRGRLLSRLNLTDGDAASLSLVYWQATLWELAAQIAPEAAASELAKLWTLPGRIPKFSVKTECRSEDAEGWSENLARLSELHKGTEFSPQPEHDYHLPEEFAWLVRTPWLRVTIPNYGRRATTPSHSYNYANAEKAPALLRLMVSLCLAVRLATSRPEAEGQAALLAFIAHAADVLHTKFPWWLKNYFKPEAREGVRKPKIPTLSSPLTGLALFGRERAKWAGVGAARALPPERFLALLREPQTAGLNDTNDGEHFATTVLPKTLMLWIEDAFPAAADADGAGRWLAEESRFIEEVYERHRRVARNEREQVQAAVITRFLCRDYTLQAGELDWRDQELQWRLNYHRRLLLTPGLPASEWDRDPEWKEPRIWDGKESEPGQGSAKPATRLVRALERLGALGPRGENGLTPELEELWRTEWKDRLGAVQWRDELDRFVRLRLLELLDCAALEDDPEGQELIVQMLVEHASIHDLKRIWEVVYSKDGRTLLEPAKSARWVLQKSCLRALHRHLECAELKLGERRTNSSAQDPRATLIDRQKVRAAQTLLARLAWLGGDAPHKTGRQLAALLREQRKQSWERRAKLRWRAGIFDVEVEGDRKRLAPREGQPPAPIWALQAAVYNPNDLTASLFWHDPDTTELTNFFALSEAEAKQALAADKLKALAVVVVAARRTREGKFEYVFNCGLDRVFAQTFPRPLDGGLRPGDYVRLELESRGDKWVPGANEPRKLPFCWRTEDLACARFTEYVAPQPGTPRLVDLRLENKKLPLDEQRWDADLSRRFHSFPARSEREVYVRCMDAAQDRWWPLDKELVDLLLDEFRAGSPVCVLTFIETVDRAAGEVAWRFATRPGENYVLNAGQFVPADAQRIEQELRRHKEPPHGLLLSVKRGPVTGEPLLTLAYEVELPPRLADLYPDWRAPFDHRNLEWQALFQQEDNLIADNEGRQWYVRLARRAPGFPERVAVEWVEHDPPYDVTRTEFSVADWDAERAVIKGDSLQQHKLPRPKDGDWRRFVDWWFNLRQDDTVTLVKVIDKQPGGDGSVRCRTREGLLAQVDIESLTMRPLAIKEGWSQLRLPRTALVLQDPKWSEPEPVELADLDDTLAALADEEQGVGLLTSVQAGGRMGLCGVVWVTSRRVKEVDLQMVDFAKFRPRPGDRLQATWEGKAWRFALERHRPPRARAVWQLVNNDPSAELFYLGLIADANGQMRPAAERGTGELVFLPAEPVRVKFGARGTGGRFAPAAEWRLGQTARNLADERFRWRAVIAPSERQELRLIGDCAASAPRPAVVLADVVCESEWQNSKTCLLYRHFKLGQPPRARQAAAETVAVSEGEVRQRELEEYLQRPTNLRSVLLRRGDEWEVDLQELRPKAPLDPEGRRWTSRVRLGPAQGKLIIEADYNEEDALVWLYRDESSGRTLASCRLVPPFSIESFTVEIGAIEGQEKTIPLYYVGPEERPAQDAAPGETMRYFRFEWGYGRTLLAPESQLRYRGAAFRTAHYILCPSDRITLFSLRIDENGHWLLDVLAVDLQFSSARVLYDQAKSYQIIHLLRLTPRGDSFEIHSIEGFSSDRFTTRHFTNVKAELTPESRHLLQQRIARDPRWLTEGPATIFGRLDWKYYEANWRDELELRFAHVRLSFLPSPQGLPLKPNEKVFLTAGKLIPGDNDCFVQLRKPRGLHREDIGEDWSPPTSFAPNRDGSIRISRRAFSVREDLLDRLRPHWEKWKGSTLLVGVRQIEESRHKDGTAMKRTYPYLWDEERLEKIPLRRLSALVGEITRQQKQKLVYAAVCGLAQGTQLYLELRPNIYFRLDTTRIPNCPIRLTAGEIVRVELLNAETPEEWQFRLTRAVFSDMRYVVSTRPAVALPKNYLRQPQTYRRALTERSFWSRGAPFTIGDLPNLEASTGYYDVEGETWWERPQPDEVTALMRQRHPKLVWLGKKESQLLLSPLDGAAPAGRLALQPDELTVRYEPLEASGSGAPLTWRRLSFGDEPAAEIIARADRIAWRFHDEMTCHWPPEEEIEKIPEEELGDQFVWTGPLFFESQDGLLLLRYHAGQFPRYGLPAAVLLQALKRAPERTDWYPVAGYSTMDGGLWVEAAPGRVVELSGQLLLRRTRLGEEQSLANMHWRGFAPGDQVQLRLLPQGELEVERLELCAWRPGPRAAFGNARCFLPVLEHDAQKGALRLGGGKYILTLPWEENAPPGATLALSPDNRLIPVRANETRPKAQPQIGDVVLLGLRDNEFHALGLPEYDVIPDRNLQQWAENPLTRDAVAPIDGKPRLDHSRLRDLVSAAGDVLPATVEGAADGALYVSLRLQQETASLPEGALSLARVVGLLRDGRTALLRCGGGLIKLRLERLIAGLPPELYATAEELLRRDGGGLASEIWLRGGRNGRIETGYSEETETSFQVEAVAVLESSVTCGLLCRALTSRKFYWLPQRCAAWARLDSAQLDRLFTPLLPREPVSPEATGIEAAAAESQPVRRAGRICTVRRMEATPTAHVSVIDVATALHEVRVLTVGRTLTVKVRERIAEGTRYVVEALNTGIFLWCDSEEELVVDYGFLAEVTRRTGRDRQSFLTLTVTPIGRKRRRLDLPALLTKDLPPAEHPSPTPSWRTPSAPEEIADSIRHCRWKDVGADGLSQLLCDYYWRFQAARPGEPTPEECRAQAEVAWRWVERNAMQVELPLREALTAVVLLDDLSWRDRLLARAYPELREDRRRELAESWRGRAGKMAANLGQRALRSLHCEVLTREWAQNMFNRGRNERHSLWLRMQQLDASLRAEPPLEEEAIAPIRQLIYAVELRDSRELRPLSRSLASALGELTPEQVPLLPELLDEQAAEYCLSLGDIYRTLLPAPGAPNAPLWLREGQRDHLHHLLEQLIAQQIELTLLDSLWSGAAIARQEGDRW